MGRSLSLQVVFILFTVTVLNIFISLHVRYQVCHWEKSDVGVPANSGYGGGVVVNEKKRKQFVTMVQKNMVDLNEQGYISMPNEIKRVWIDVGSSSESFLGNCGSCRRRYWLNRSELTLNQEFRRANDLHVIAIDANSDYHEPLLKIPRLTPIITGIFPIEGTRAFHEYGGAGCSSFLEPNKNFDRALSKYHWARPCTTVKKVTGVAALRLETILAIIDPRLHIELLKVDAQGVDLDVVKSAGKQLSRVAKVIVEVQIENKKKKASNILYHNANTASDTVEYMQANGFSFDRALSNVENEAIEEYNYVFNNARL